MYEFEEGEIGDSGEDIDNDEVDSEDENGSDEDQEGGVMECMTTRQFQTFLKN